MRRATTLNDEQSPQAQPLRARLVRERVVPTFEARGLGALWKMAKGGLAPRSFRAHAHVFLMHSASSEQLAYTRLPPSSKNRSAYLQLSFAALLTAIKYMFNFLNRSLVSRRAKEARARAIRRVMIGSSHEIWSRFTKQLCSTWVDWGRLPTIRHTNKYLTNTRAYRAKNLLVYCLSFYIIYFEILPQYFFCLQNGFWKWWGLENKGAAKKS